MNRETGKFTRFVNIVGRKNVIPDNLVQKIFQDSRNRIWIFTKKGIAFYTKESNHFKSVQLSDTNRFNCLTMFESGGQVWFTGNSGVYRFDENKSVLQKIVFPKQSNPKRSIVYKAISDNIGNTWFGTGAGLWKVDLKNSKLIHSGFPDTALNQSKITALLVKNGHLWIGTSNGLIDWAINTKLYKYYGYVPNNPDGLRSTYINTLASDKNGNIWIGTSISVQKLQVDQSQISFYVMNQDFSLKDQINHVPRIYQDQDGFFWTWNGKGIFRSKGFGENMEAVKNTPYPHFLEHFLSLTIDGKKEVFMSYSAPGKGLFHYNFKKNSIERYKLNNTLDSLGLYNFEFDLYDRNILWVGTVKGICLFNLKTKDTSWIHPLAYKTVVRNFEQYDDGTIGIMFPEGYSMYNRSTKTHSLHLYNENASNMFNSGLIRDFQRGLNNSLWIATENGLTFFDGKTGKYTNYTTNNGLKGGNIIYSLHVDKRGTCWFVTNSYLININPYTKKFRYFNASDGVLATFNRWSYCKLRNGNVLFGGINGMICFNPDSFQLNKNKPKLILTRYLVNNKEPESELLPENIRQIKVGYEQNALTFEFASLEFIASEKNEYAYKMDGFDDEWNYSGNERRATYTNLSPGTYHFLAKCSNSDGVWNDKDLLKIQVVILPLYYQTWWFRGFMLLVIAAVIYLLLRNSRKERQLEQQKTIAEQNSRYKSKFLTNMSHEIRTPMNAIIGLNRLLLDTGLTEKQKKYAGAVQQSSENLLWIVNDILDQAKIESGKYTIVQKPFQLDVILKQIHNLLAVKAEEKELNFHFEISNTVPLKLIGDPLRLYQILTNLVANAIKFTDKGSISLIVNCSTTIDEMATLHFIVKDTGIGIPKDKLKEIFESFNQLEQVDSSNAGTGLGLSIAQELVLQLGGKIEVDSEEASGTVFTVTLPYKIDTHSGITLSSSASLKKSNKPLRILIVDDAKFNILLA